MMTNCHFSTPAEPATPPPVKPRDARAKMIGALKSVLKIVLAVALLAWLARSGRLSLSAVTGLGARSVLWLGLAALLQASMIASMGARWRAWLRAIPLPGGARARLSWRESMLANARGACAGAWTPAGLGLDGIRAAHALRRFQTHEPHDQPLQAAHEEPQREAPRGLARLLLNRVNRGAGTAASGIGRAVALASLLDRAAALAMLLALSLPFLASRIAPGVAGAATGAALAGAACIALTLLLLERRLRGSAGAACWALATHAANILALGAGLEALAPQLAPSRALWLALEVGPAIILSSALPLTPLGLGVADATGSALLAHHGLSCGGELVMLCRASWLVVCLLAGLAFWLPDSRPDAEPAQK